ncbi:hypothetical protein IB275_30535 [Pseudomonas sp. PDM21]|uniref:hypothetical protein n=1 Tax=Pseudomonas sp. PDM21 TaxID=2769257 RepID=UPI00177B9EAF|nr:hypothetical protein [Pseudomonas sp. PDM21]MBD9674954.1 hypothetical protein [Pseudomonas sp. PDM21]
MPTSPVEQEQHEVEAPQDVGNQADPSSAAPEPTQPEVSAEQTEKSEAEQHAEYLEVVTQAAKEAEAPQAQTPEVKTSQLGKDADSAPAKAEGGKTEQVEQPEEEDEGDDRGEPFGKHPRWQKMVAARNQYRTQAQESARELEALRPRADQYGLVERYMQDNGLTAQEVTDGFQIMALMKLDPAQARERLVGHLRTLDAYLGHALPPDLQKQVDEGFVTEDMAKELAYRRNLEVRHQNESQAQQQALQQQQVQEQSRTLRAGMATAVASWESQIKQTDPEYAKKEPFVLRELQALMQQYRVQSPEQAVQLAQMAYSNANKALRGLIPRPEVKTNPAGQMSAPSSQAKAEPRSFLEACLQAAEIKQ